MQSVNIYSSKPSSYDFHNQESSINSLKNHLGVFLLNRSQHFDKTYSFFNDSENNMKEHIRVIYNKSCHIHIRHQSQYELETLVKDSRLIFLISSDNESLQQKVFNVFKEIKIQDLIQYYAITSQDNHRIFSDTLEMKQKIKQVLEQQIMMGGNSSWQNFNGCNLAQLKERKFVRVSRKNAPSNEIPPPLDLNTYTEISNNIPKNQSLNMDDSDDDL